MIGYVTIGTNDLESSRRFYDAVLAPLGGKIIVNAPGLMIFYGTEGGSTMLALCNPYDKGVASFGNGSMFGIPAATHALVDEAYRVALENGATDEGAPGYRTPQMYIAYFRDPVGNKLAVYNLPSVREFAIGAEQMAKEILAMPSAH